MVDTNAPRLLDTPDCEVCGAPVVGSPSDGVGLHLDTRPGRYCSASCSLWAGNHPGQRRERPPCEECGETLHFGFAVNGKWCTLRCRNRAKSTAPPLPLLPRLGPWAADAKCIDAAPEAFFPEKGGNGAEAKQICAACPVRAECLEYALSVEHGRQDAFGIFGGLSANERAKIVQERAGRSAERAGVLPLVRVAV